MFLELKAHFFYRVKSLFFIIWGYIFIMLAPPAKPVPFHRLHNKEYIYIFETLWILSTIILYKNTEQCFYELKVKIYYLANHVWFVGG